MSQRNLDNIYITERGESKNFTPVSRLGSKDNFPVRKSRKDHASYIEKQFNKAWELGFKQKEKKSIVSTSTKDGVYLQIKGKEGYDLFTKSLENITQHVRLYNIREDENGVISATVFVPNDKKNFFLSKINKYKETEKDEKVIGTIENINLAFVEELWIGNKSSLPLNLLRILFGVKYG